MIIRPVAVDTYIESASVWAFRDHVFYALYAPPLRKGLTATQITYMILLRNREGVRMKRKLLAGIMIMVCLIASIPAGAASFAKSKAGIKYGGAVYRVGQTSTKWKSKLGKYSRKLVETNGSLLSYRYTFKGKGIRVSTLYSTKYKKEKIVAILMVGKTVPTNSGLRVGNSGSKMVNLYGRSYSKKGNLYTYKAGGRRLIVKAIGNRVYGIKIT
jgi:hypothetical protein